MAGKGLLGFCNPVNMWVLQKSDTRCQNKRAIHAVCEFVEDIFEHGEHVGDTYVQRA